MHQSNKKLFPTPKTGVFNDAGQQPQNAMKGIQPIKSKKRLPKMHRLSKKV